MRRSVAPVMHPFTAQKRRSVAALGERVLIREIRKWLGRTCPPPPAGIGDDCAVLQPSKRPQLVTVDPVIFGRHFDARVPAEWVGEKLLKRNLSDIAAMGGRPRVAVVALMLDPRTRIDWLRGFYRGLATAARRFDTQVVGGDVAQATGTLAASVTLIGEATARAISRSGARLGDWIFVTGTLGNTLRTGHHFRFTPRLTEGAWLARQKEVTAMMDVSDGLAKDVHALCPRGAKPVLYPSALPLREGADLRAALSDGEDYELLFAVSGDKRPYDFIQRWQRAFPAVRLSCVGGFASGVPADAIDLESYHGYEHLR